MRRAGGALAQGGQAPPPKALAKAIKRGGAAVVGRCCGDSQHAVGSVRLLGWAVEGIVQQGVEGWGMRTEKQGRYDARDHST